jgi:hypothetical protein
MTRSEEKKPMGVRLDADLHALAKELRVREGISVTWLVNHLLREYFEKRKES